MNPINNTEWFVEPSYYSNIYLDYYSKLTMDRLDSNIYSRDGVNFEIYVCDIDNTTKGYSLLNKIQEKEFRNSRLEHLYAVLNPILDKIYQENLPLSELNCSSRHLIDLVDIVGKLSTANAHNCIRFEVGLSLLNSLAVIEVTAENYRDVELNYCPYCDKWQITTFTRIDNTYICSECADEHIATCMDCGCNIILDDETTHRVTDGYICYNCNLDRIYSYEQRNHASFSPTPIFYPNIGCDRYYGTENELIMSNDFSNELFTEAEACQKHLVYAKEDCTITRYTKYEDYDWGIEFVTHPMTLSCHEEYSKEFYKYLKDNGAVIGKQTGLHIHVNREAVPIEVFKTIELFIEEYQTQFLNLSRRKEFNGYCKPKTLDIDTLTEKQAKLGDYYDRYHLVNFENRHTVEFRLFGATTSEYEYLSSIYIIDSLIEYFSAGKEFDYDKWKNYAISHYNVLHDYFIDRA